ncbi:MAG: cation:proton antiporter [Nitrososphaerales archaeon]
MGEESLILPLVLPLVAASLMGLLFQRVGLSLVAGYIAGGIIVGPILGLVEPSSQILSFLSELGIILIAFEVGLAVKMDFFSRGGARAAGIVGVEVATVSLISYMAGSALSLRWGDTLVLAFMAANTSTAITFKILEERRYQQTESRRLVLAVGAFEDIVAIVGLSIFPIMSHAGVPSLLDLLGVVAAVLVSITVMVYLGLRVLKEPLEWIAKRESEILVAISLAVVLIYSYVGVISGLSAALGAFVAGLVISNMKVSESVSDKLRSLRDLSALIFFSSIGASLPIMEDPLSIAVVLGVALLVVFVKFFGFSVSSWILGLKLEDSFRLGLYMLAISEFGVIIAKDAVESGIASQSIYLVSVIALVASAVLSSSLVKYENSLSKKLSGLMPPPLRLSLEGFFTTLRDVVTSRSSELVEIRRALWELVKRLAIISIVVFGANLAIAYITPLLPLAIKPHIETAIGLFTIGTVLLIAIRMKRVFVRLSKSVVAKIGDSQRQVEDVVVRFLYALTLGVVSVAMIIVSYEQIVRAFTLILSREGASVASFLLIVVILTITYRYALQLAKRLEKIFEIEG